MLNNYAVSRLVIKVNGDFERATFRKDLRWGVILTRQQFDRALVDRPEIWRLFEDDFRSRSIVFVGVSFQDPTLRQVVALATERIPKTHHMHYLLSKVAENPIEQALQIRESQNLERFHIRTLWFRSHSEMRRFVARLAVIARRPIVGVSGTAQTKGVGDADDDAFVLPNGQIKAGELREISRALGQVLVRQRYRVTSGGAPYVGMEAVEAAFSIQSSSAQFYFRHGGGRSYRRMAPAIIVDGTDYTAMRDRFIGELSLLIAIGGYRVEGDHGGVEEEIRLAASLGIPVLLFPQAGGDVARVLESLKADLHTSYPGDILWPAVKRANDECAAVPADKLLDFIRGDLSRVIEEVLEFFVESATDSRASRNTRSSEYNW